MITKAASPKRKAFYHVQLTSDEREQLIEWYERVLGEWNFKSNAVEAFSEEELTQVELAAQKAYETLEWLEKELPLSLTMLRAILREIANFSGLFVYGHFSPLSENERLRSYLLFRQRFESILRRERAQR